MFLFCFFPLCKHTTLSAAVNVCSSHSKPFYKEKFKPTFSLQQSTHAHVHWFTQRTVPVQESRQPRKDAQRHTNPSTSLAYRQTPLTCSSVPERSRSLTVNGKPEELSSCDLCTSRGYWVILALPIGWVGSQPSVPPSVETSINTTCECHCLANVITPIKQTERAITSKAFILWENKWLWWCWALALHLFIGIVHWYSEYSWTRLQIINVILLYLWWCRRSRDSCAEYCDWNVKFTFLFSYHSAGGNLLYSSVELRMKSCYEK